MLDYIALSSVWSWPPPEHQTRHYAACCGFPLWSCDIICVCVCVAACIQPGAEAEWDRKQEGPWRRCQIWNSPTGNDSSPLLYDHVQHDSADLFKLRKPGVSGSETQVGSVIQKTSYLNECFQPASCPKFMFIHHKQPEDISVCLCIHSFTGGWICQNVSACPSLFSLHWFKRADANHK